MKIVLQKRSNKIGVRKQLYDFYVIQLTFGLYLWRTVCVYYGLYNLNFLKEIKGSSIDDVLKYISQHEGS